MKRSLADWASIAEILGAIAIVVSLIFVGLEIRGNTSATQTATFQEHVGNEIEILLALSAAPPDAMETYYQQTTGEPFTLETVDEERGWLLMIAAMRLWEDLYLQWFNGTASDQAWESRAPTVARFAMGSGVETLLQQGFFSEEFDDYLRGVRIRAEL